jgi:GH25 family lysozyme M1 (1,4-beta-N-acetylmuramidase)
LLWGRPLIIYTYPFFAHSVQFDVSLASARLYIASYQEVPAIPAPWTSYVIQQTSDGGGRLPNGCPVDQNVIRDEPTLASLLA